MTSLTRSFVPCSKPRSNLKRQSETHTVVVSMWKMKRTPAGITKHSPIKVLEKLWEVEKFGRELLNVIGVVHEQLPCLRNGVELAVGHVEAAALQLDVERCEGLHPDEVVEHARTVGVVSAIMELGYHAWSGNKENVGLEQGRPKLFLLL